MMMKMVQKENDRGKLRLMDVNILLRLMTFYLQQKPPAEGEVEQGDDVFSSWKQYVHDNGSIDLGPYAVSRIVASITAEAGSKNSNNGNNAIIDDRKSITVNNIDDIVTRTTTTGNSTKTGELIAASHTNTSYILLSQVSQREGFTNESLSATLSSLPRPPPQPPPLPVLPSFDPVNFTLQYLTDSHSTRVQLAQRLCSNKQQDHPNSNTSKGNSDLIILHLRTQILL